MSHISFRDNLLAVLAGGLPAILEGGTSGNTPIQPEGSAVNPNRVEEIPPTGTLQDREPFRLFQSGISQPVLLGTAGIIGLLAVFLIARR